MIYSGTGERVAVKDDSSWTVNLGDAYRCEGGRCTRILYGTHGIIGTFTIGTSEYLITDHLNSTIATLNSHGAVARPFEYFPFGAAASRRENSNESPAYRFIGRELDRSGLYHLGARYYDPIIGRFISPDPLAGSFGAPQSLNPYSYALNNPLKLSDPTGLKVMNDGDRDREREGGERNERFGRNPEFPLGDTRGSSTLPEPSENEGSSGNPLESPNQKDPVEQNIPSDGAPDRSSPAPVRDGRSDYQGSQRQGGAPNFDPINGQINPDHAVTAAAVLMTWLFGTRPLIQGVIRIFQSKGHDDQEVGEDEDEFGGPQRAPLNFCRKDRDQMKKRGWYEEQVQKAYNQPYTTRKAIDKSTGDTATVFYPDKGMTHYISVNDRTGEIIQFSDRRATSWNPDDSIKNPYTGEH